MSLSKSIYTTKPKRTCSHQLTFNKNTSCESRHPWGTHANLLSDANAINGRWLNETTSAFRWSREQTATTQGTLTRLWILWKQLAISLWNIWAGHIAAQTAHCETFFSQIVFSVSPFKPHEWKFQKVTNVIGKIVQAIIGSNHLTSRLMARLLHDNGRIPDYYKKQIL